MAKLDLLIDGDLLLYKTACGVEKEVQWDEENHVLFANMEDAWGCIQDNIIQLTDKFSTNSIIFALTGKGNFRKDLFPLYKANRQGTRKPLCYADLAARLRDEYKVIQYDRIEADDILGILATKPSQSKRIIVSEDKDMRSIPCTLYAKGEVSVVSEEEADYNHMFQTLCGDQADGYPGCPKIGPVKAAAILDAYKGGSLWAGVMSAYHKADQSTDYALTQARLARILRWEDWDSVKKEPILWTPKG
jgi:DNA polymerase-1